MGSRGKNSIVAGLAAGCILIGMAIVGPSANDSARGSAALPASGWHPDEGQELEAPARWAVAPSATAAETPAAEKAQKTGR